MYVFFNQNGEVKEIVNDKALRRANDNVNHIYFIVDNFDDSDYNNITVSYKLPSGAIIGPQVVSLDKVKKNIPYNKDRLLKQFIAYKEYEFYDIAIPDGTDSTLGNALAEQGLVKTTISFISVSETLALQVLPFYVEESVVRATTNISGDQYSYLLQLLSDKQSKIIPNFGGIYDDNLTSIRIDDKTYGITGGGGGGTLDKYVIKAEEASTIDNYNVYEITQTNSSITSTLIMKGKPKKYVKSSVVDGKILRIANIKEDDTEEIISYGADTGGFATTDQLNAEIQDRKDADNLKVDISLVAGGWTNLVKNDLANNGPSMTTSNTTYNIQSGVAVNNDLNILAEIYAINLDDKKGTRIIVKKDHIYYTKDKTTTDVNASDELLTKNDITSFQEKIVAGNNITINADGKTINSNQIDDTATATSTEKTYSINKINTLLQNKTNRVLDGANGKSLVFNENDGGGVKFENNNGEHSYVGVNDGTIGAQIYQLDKDTKVGTRINVTKGAIYYTNGKSDATYTATDEIATKNDVATETTRATTAEGTLTTNLGNEVTRATTKETELENKFADYDTKTEINTKLADYAKSTDVYAKTETYSQTEVNTELAKKANDFDIDTATLEWDTTGTLRKLKAIIPSAMHFKTSKDYVSEVLAITTHEDGDLYWAWKDDRTEPQATAPVVNAFIVWSGTDNKWVYAGSTEVDLTDYLKKTDAESTYAKINNVYAKTDTYSKTEANAELAKKQDLLVNQNNISSIGTNIANQFSLLDNSIINITIDGGEITGTFSDIKISIDAVNCKIIGQDHYELTSPKTSLPPTLQVKFTDFTGTAPDDVEVKLDGTLLVKDTDYKWGGDTGNLKLLETCMNKLKLDSSCELTIKCEGV